VNFGRPQPELSLDEERAMLRESRAALDELKSELADRVQAVREREEELRQALAATQEGRPPHPAAHTAPARDGGDNAATALELERRTAALAERERALAAQAAALTARERSLAEREAAGATSTEEPVPTAEREARIEARLAELREAEKLFLRTREELSARSEAVAARERLVSQRERELDEIEDAPKREARELAALEERLARLERGQGPSQDTLGFSDGFRRLRESGARQPPDARRP
jgi:chromosome segregation ATPase